MSVYVLDIPRFDKAYSGNVRYERHVVYGEILAAPVTITDPTGALPPDLVPEGTRSVWKILDDKGEPVDLGTWMVAERTGLYEEMAKAERRWTSDMLGDGDNWRRAQTFPGRVK